MYMFMYTCAYDRNAGTCLVNQFPYSGMFENDIDGVKDDLKHDRPTYIYHT